MPRDMQPPPVDWMVSPGLVPYEAACAVMAARVDAIAAGEARELVWLIEHPPLYTAGTSAKPGDLLEPARLPVFRTGRGGQFTYHGPGQRVVYVMLDVRRRTGDVRAFVAGLEAWLIDSLALLGVTAGRREGLIGVWVPEAEAGHAAKIAAVGIRLRRWISSHGFSLNVSPNLSDFAGIVPCGLHEPVTSLAQLGRSADLGVADAALREVFERRFGPAHDVPAPDLSTGVSIAMGVAGA